MREIMLGASRGGILTFVVIHAFSIGTATGVWATICAVLWFVSDMIGMKNAAN